MAGDARYNLSDRMHPNPEGYRRILEYIYPYVLAVIKGESEGRGLRFRGFEGPRFQGVEGGWQQRAIDS